MSFQIHITNNTGKAYLSFIGDDFIEVRSGMRLELKFPATIGILSIFEQLDAIAKDIKAQMCTIKGCIETKSTESGQYIDHEVLGDLELKITDSEAEKVGYSTTHYRI